MSLKVNYNPRYGSFPHRTIHYLNHFGESKNETIRWSIGIDVLSEGCEWEDRGEFYFNNTLIPRLIEKGVIVRTKWGFYDLTPEWRKKLSR